MNRPLSLTGPSGFMARGLAHQAAFAASRLPLRFSIDAGLKVAVALRSGLFNLGNEHSKTENGSKNVGAGYGLRRFLLWP